MDKRKVVTTINDRTLKSLSDALNTFGDKPEHSIRSEYENDEIIVRAEGWFFSVPKDQIDEIVYDPREIQIKTDYLYITIWSWGHFHMTVFEDLLQSRRIPLKTPKKPVKRRSHKKTYTPSTCSECGKTFLNEHGRNIHIAQVHRKTVVPTDHLIDGA